MNITRAQSDGQNFESPAFLRSEARSGPLGQLLLPIVPLRLFARRPLGLAFALTTGKIIASCMCLFARSLVSYIRLAATRFFVIVCVCVCVCVCLTVCVAHLF